MHGIQTEAIEALLGKRESTIARDLKLNLKRLLNEAALEPVESLAALLAVSKAVGYEPLAAFARTELAARDLSSEQIQEAGEVPAIMGMLNTYYRARHMIARDEYKTAGLRMTALARPVLGKERFEMLAFAVSVLNGCESCVRSHELALRESGVTAEKIHDLMRLSAVAKGLSVLALG